MAAGAAKARVVAAILEGPRDPTALPGVLARRSSATWVIDATAASGLGRATRIGDPSAERDLIRPATSADAGEVADVWLTAFAATYDFPPRHTDDEVRSWIRDELLPGSETWLAVDPDGSIAGFMALGSDVLDHLYLRPERTGRGIGSRCIGLAKSLRPGGLELYTFQVNTGARRFYERHGFRVVDLDDGGRNEEGQPDVRYRGCRTTRRIGDRAARVDELPGRDPDRLVPVRDGAADRARPRRDRRPHRLADRGAAPRADAHAVRDRSTRPRSERRHVPYAIAREYEDVAAVVDAVAAAEGTPVDVVGHSYGGRVGLGAALLSPSLRRLVVYEGAPAPAGRSFQGDEVMARLEAFSAADDRQGCSSTSWPTSSGCPRTSWRRIAARRAGRPGWRPRRPSSARCAAEAAEDAGPERYAAIRMPVLQLIGGDSGPIFTDGSWALDRLLRQRTGGDHPRSQARRSPHPRRAVRGRGPRVPRGRTTIRR